MKDYSMLDLILILSLAFILSNVSTMLLIGKGDDIKKTIASLFSIVSERFEEVDSNFWKSEIPVSVSQGGCPYPVDKLAKIPSYYPDDDPFSVSKQIQETKERLGYSMTAPDFPKPSYGDVDDKAFAPAQWYADKSLSYQKPAKKKEPEGMSASKNNYTFSFNNF